MAEGSIRERLREHLADLIFYLELQEANPFKIRAFRGARDVLKELSDEEFIEKLNSSKLTSIKGIGKGIQKVAEDYAESGNSEEFQEASKGISPSLLELKEISGLGPKKIKILYEELGIKSLGELEYACNENRLVDLKGFGAKTQAKVYNEIQLIKGRRGKHLLSDALEKEAQFKKKLKPGVRFVAVGELGRRSETLDCLEFLTDERESKKKTPKWLETSLPHKKEKKSQDFLRLETKDGYDLKIYFSEKSEWATREVYLTSSEEHWKALCSAAKKEGLQLEQNALKQSGKPVPLSSAEELYETIKLVYHPAEAREKKPRAKKHSFLELKDITGVFHAHSTYSDGANTLEEMAATAQDKGWSYLGISEHSQTAFYARGLKKSELERQWKEIDELQKKMSGFRIFKGIESDILKDGRLDYSDSILKNFDFVIASIHQRYGQKEMTDRIIKAMQNPYTRMIGHLSGRLLLAREAYELDIDKIVDAAIETNTIIEFNSNPHRLDIDWRYLESATKRGLVISLNPDAHSTKGFDDIQYGVWMANKAGVSKDQIFNTWPLKKIEDYLSSDKSQVKAV